MCAFFRGDVALFRIRTNLDDSTKVLVRAGYREREGKDAVIDFWVDPDRLAKCQ